MVPQETSRPLLKRNNLKSKTKQPPNKNENLKKAMRLNKHKTNFPSDSSMMLVLSMCQSCCYEIKQNTHSLQNGKCCCTFDDFKDGGGKHRFL